MILTYSCRFTLASLDGSVLAVGLADDSDWSSSVLCNVGPVASVADITDSELLFCFGLSSACQPRLKRSVEDAS